MQYLLHARGTWENAKEAIKKATMLCYQSMALLTQKKKCIQKLTTLISGLWLGA